MAGMMRSLPMNIQNPENLIVYQKLLGQMLFIRPMLQAGLTENRGSTVRL
jgi:hypothetical protein